MTRKDYVKAAEIVRNAAKFDRRSNVTILAIQNAFIALFRGDNPRFQIDRFISACQPTNDR